MNKVNIVSVLSSLFFSFLIGSIYIILTLPKTTIRFSRQVRWNWLENFGIFGLQTNTFLSNFTPKFSTLIFYIFIGIGFYILSLFFLSFYHKKFNIFISGVTSLLLSTISLHLIAWITFLVAALTYFVFRIFGLIGGFFGFIFSSSFKIILNIFISFANFVIEFFHSIFGNYWIIGLIFIGVLILFLVIKIGKNIVDALKMTLIISLAGILILGLIYSIFWVIKIFFIPILSTFFKFLSRIFSVFFNFLLSIFVFFLKFLLVLCIFFVISIPGQLLIDQVKGALSAGNQRMGAIIGSMAIGSSLAILLMVSNVYRTDFFLPDIVSRVIFDSIYQKNPILDTLISLFIIGLSLIGIFLNIPKLKNEPSMSDFNKSAIYSVLGVMMSSILAFISNTSEE